MPQVEGTLRDNKIFIQDRRHANQIYSKGFFGTPISGGSLVLSLLEGIYLAEQKKLTVLKIEPVDFSTLVKEAAKVYSEFDTKYTVYHDLRLRGYVVKEFDDMESIHFKVYTHSAIPSKHQPKYFCIAYSENTQFKLAHLKKALQSSFSEDKRLLVAVVDDECDPTYYTVKFVSPIGYEPPEDNKVSTEGYLIGDKVVISDEDSISTLQKLHYGETIGARLQISLVEAAYLFQHNKIVIKDVRTDRKFTYAKFLKFALKHQQDFKRKLKVYNDLKAAHHTIKTGFKYGTHFRVYEKIAPAEHARYLVQVVPPNYSTNWSEISRAIRIAHVVRKEILFATVSKDEINYIQIARIKP